MVKENITLKIGDRVRINFPKSTYHDKLGTIRFFSFNGLHKLVPVLLDGWDSEALYFYLNELTLVKEKEK